MSSSPLSPTGSTRVAAIIGDPVRHSLSPAIHNAALRELGADWVFVAFEVPAGATDGALAAMRALGVGALSVTMPHKTRVAHLVDHLSPDARVLDAVNCVVLQGQTLVGHNTDGDGFVRSLRDETGFDPSGRTCVVFGGGGAARAVVLALGRAGASRVVVVNRDPGRARAAAALAGPSGAVGDRSVLAEADLVVNATPVGMGRPAHDGESVIDPAVLPARCVVADLVYEPRLTALVSRSRERGLTAIDGLGMLVHQAAIQIEHYVGSPAPLDVMVEAALVALAQRSR